MKKCPVCKKIMSPNRPCSYCGYKDEVDPKLVLDIIETKEVIMPDFMESCKSFPFTYNHYITYRENYAYDVLTKEEFDILNKYFTRNFK